MMGVRHAPARLRARGSPHYTDVCMTIGRAIRWRAWGADAFAEAHAARRPVLLSIHVAWSAACRQMDDETFADPAVVALVDDRLVPIRVDADQRPDIGERYSLGGWPTTVFLTPDGECLGGGTFVEPDRLRAALEDVSASFESRRDEIWRSGLEARRRRAATVHASAGLDDTAPARVAMRLRETFDETWAGFGLGVKVPDEAPLAFALRHGVATVTRDWSRSRSARSIGSGGATCPTASRGRFGARAPPGTGGRPSPPA